MGYGEGFMNFQLFIQKAFDFPWFYETSSQRFVLNPKWSKNYTRYRKMPLWHLTTRVFVPFFFCYCFAQILIITNDIFNQKEVKMEEMSTYVFVLLMAIYGLLDSYTAEKDIETGTCLITVLDTTLTLCRIEHIGFPTLSRMPDLQELKAYGIMLGFLCYPLIVSTWPFLFDFDPVNVLFKNLLPDLSRMIFASIIYTIITFLGVMICGTFILLLLTIMHSLEVFTLNILNRTKEELGKKKGFRNPLFLVRAHKQFTLEKNRKYFTFQQIFLEIQNLRILFQAFKYCILDFFPYL